MPPQCRSSEAQQTAAAVRAVATAERIRSGRQCNRSVIRLARCDLASAAASIRHCIQCRCCAMISSDPAVQLYGRRHSTEMSVFTERNAIGYTITAASITAAFTASVSSTAIASAAMWHLAACGSLVQCRCFSRGSQAASSSTLHYSRQPQPPIPFWLLCHACAARRAVYFVCVSAALAAHKVLSTPRARAASTH